MNRVTRALPALPRDSGRQARAVELEMLGPDGVRDRLVDELRRAGFTWARITGSLIEAAPALEYDDHGDVWITDKVVLWAVVARVLGGSALGTGNGRVSIVLERRLVGASRRWSEVTPYIHGSDVGISHRYVGPMPSPFEGSL
jgi:hypothetical protein